MTPQGKGISAGAPRLLAKFLEWHYVRLNLWNFCGRNLWVLTEEFANDGASGGKRQ
jgi:hypothetical protein